MNTTTATTYRLRSDVRFRIIGGEAVVLRQDDAESLVLNGVGSRMLELLVGGENSDRVLTELAAEYEVAPEQLADDLDQFAAELEASGVLERADAGEDG